MNIATMKYLGTYVIFLVSELLLNTFRWGESLFMET